MDIRFLKSRKAILFSLMSVLFSVLFITVFSQNFSSSIEDKIPGSNIRIKVLDIYTRNFEKYVEDSVKVSAYRSLESLTKYAGTEGFYSNEAEFKQYFSNCMKCGTMDCASGPQCPAGSPGYDLKSRLDTITALADTQLNINTTYTINSIDISQSYPFDVDVVVSISYNISDKTGNYYAQWRKSKVITQSVSIIGLLDPEGHIESNGYFNKSIIRYVGECEFNEYCWNTTNTAAFYQEDSYRYYGNGTGFLQRYWNDNSPSECCGIENIIHPSQLQPSQTDRNNTFIDHYYWDDTYKCTGIGSVKILNVSIAGDYISMDEITAGRYDVTSLGTVICP